MTASAINKANQISLGDTSEEVSLFVAKICYNSLMAKNIPKQIDADSSKSHISKRHTMPGCLRVLLSVVFLMAISVLFAWFIEVRHRMNDIDATWEWILSNPLVFWYSCMLLFLILSFIVSLCWCTFFGTGLTFAIISIITYINMEKYKARQAPLLPEDFQMASNLGEVAGFVDVWGIGRLVLGVIFILVGSGMLEYYARKHIGRDTVGMPRWQRWSIIPRTTFALLSAVALMMTTSFIVHHKQTGDQYVKIMDTDFISWNQAGNYQKNGFLIGFLYNLGGLEMEQPDDYNELRIKEIYEKYTATKESDTTRKDIGDVADNIIIVLDETFYDPEVLAKHYPHTGGDPLPNLRKLFEKYPSGYMYSPEYGGGTANVEFEMFTGLSNYWANSMQYINTVPKLPALDSVASWALDNDFRTLAIHGFDGSVYKRNIVYPKLGFEKFIDIYKLDYDELENGQGYLSDSSIYQQILDILENSDEPQLIGASTMQNHTPYDTAGYTQLDYKITGEFPNEALEHSFQSLHNADKYLGDFIKELDKLNEKTVVLWFGDHAAGILGAYMTSPDKVDTDLAHITPYFIYANFDLENELYTEKEIRQQYAKQGLEIKTGNVDLPATTPNCLVNALYNLLDVKKPTLMYLLDEVCAVEPILARTYLESKSPVDNDIMRAYELVNYDILSGERYWAKEN